MQTLLLFSLLAVMSFLGCQKSETTGPARTAGAKTETLKPAESPAVQKFRQMAQEPAPARPNFCTALAWSEKLSDFMFVNQENLEKAGFQKEISAEYERRGKVRDEALVRALRRNLIIPKCEDGKIYDPIRWLMYAYGNKRIPRDLLLAAFKTAAERDHLPRLRSEDWDEQESVHLFWRLIPGQLDLTADELHEIGLTPAETKNVFGERK